MELWSPRVPGPPDRGAGYARARANFRGCPNHVPMWGGLQWKQESKPWKLWSALPAPKLKPWDWDTRSSSKGTEQDAPRPGPRLDTQEKRGGGAEAGNSVAGEAETTGRPLGLFRGSGEDQDSGSLLQFGSPSRERRQRSTDVDGPRQHQPLQVDLSYLCLRRGGLAAWETPMTQDPRPKTFELWACRMSCS